VIAVTPVVAVFRILISLIVVTPVLAIVGSLFLEGFVLAIAATAIALVALALHNGDVHRLTTILKPIAPVLLLPCLWMLLQVIPVASHWLAHPAWMSASAALGKPLLGTVSLDIGATLLCVARYSLMLAIAVVTIATALDRQRAEVILFLLTAAAALIAAGLIGLSYFRITGFELSPERAQMATIAVVGMILSCAPAIQAYERREMQRTRSRKSSDQPAYAIAFSTATFAICLLAIMTVTDSALLLAAVCGSGVLISVTAIRRLRLGPWGRSGIVAAVIVGLIGFFAASPIAKDGDLTLALASPSQISTPTAERILADARWAGTGAGTFRALSLIYRDADDADSYAAPTAAAVVAIEMGRPFLWTLVILALISAWMLFKRSLTRGRDYFYAGAGAGCIVAILITSFANAGAFGLVAQLFIAAVCGLALAQSKSWRSPDQAISGVRIPSDMRGSSTDRGIRIGLLAFASILAMQAIWIILAEYYHQHRIHLPMDPEASHIASQEHENASQAAALAMFRGDLWAESAFTHSDLLWKEPATVSAANENVRKETQMDIEHALRYAPHRGDVWLMLAAMADRYNWQDYQPNSLLKMSYFTAPSDLSLFPLRIKVSLRANAIQDPEIQDMIRRDIRVVVTKSPALKPALATAYRSSSVEGKAFLDRTISEIDPVYLAVIRAGLR
jgi:hypothetical protein